MSSFIQTWLLAAVPILQRELSDRAELIPAEQLPSPAKTVSLAVSLGHSATGRFTVSADLSAFNSILVEAGLVGSESDARRDYELWRNLIREIAVATAEAFGGAKVELIEDAQWSLGSPSAAYELRLGNSKMLIAFADQVQARRESEAGTRPASAADVEAPRKGDRPGIDLLLDVELEASLRFGSCEMSLNAVLDLGPGDVVELDRHVGDPVDLLVGDKIVARGEVVLVNGAFGLRVVEVAEPRKRLESVRCLF
jgi:flagellar motor switch protein FliN/FliY